MKNINITRDDAISTISTLVQNVCCIPMVSLGNGGSGFDYFSNATLEAFKADLEDTDNYIFRVVPLSEIAEDFEGNINLDWFDVCVEFASTSGDNPYREQYLLWFD